MHDENLMTFHIEMLKVSTHWLVWSVVGLNWKQQYRHTLLRYENHTYAYMDISHTIWIGECERSTCFFTQTYNPIISLLYNNILFYFYLFYLKLEVVKNLTTLLFLFLSWGLQLVRDIIICKNFQSGHKSKVYILFSTHGQHIISKVYIMR